jgi:glycosyltransferase involved in cell wall biosynthesis
MNGLRIGVIGGVPPVLGGGGLEHQIDVTIAALKKRGHDIRPAAQFTRDEPPQLMHSFGNGADIWQLLRHWRINRVPLVASPVIVCSPGRSERNLLIGAQIGRMVPNVNSMTRDIVREADHVVALTGYESSVVKKLAPHSLVEIVGNGVTPVEPAGVSPVPEGDPYVVMLGTIGERKHQVEALDKLGARHRMVIVGGTDPNINADTFNELADSRGAVWLGEVVDQSVIRRVLADAEALLLFSDAEALSLAVLEALACGTPVVASPLPSHVQLSQEHPGWVHTAGSFSEADSILSSLTRPDRSTRPAIPTWDDIAEQLEAIYKKTLADN